MMEKASLVLSAISALSFAPLASVSELQALILQMAGSGITEVGTAAVLATEHQVSSFTSASGTQTAGIKKNMRRAFGE